MNLILKYFFVVIILSSCAKRISRPNIVGFVYDSITKKAIKDVEINTWDKKNNIYKTETKTEKKGKFILTQLTYYDKLAIGGESPMEFYNFILNKKKYIEKKIKGRSKYGFSKDTTVYDTIYLIKK